MICFVENRPVLLVGRHQIAHYDTGWIRQALERAAEDCDRGDFPFIDEILNGVIHYLESRCSLRLLPLEDFYARLRHMLEKLRCEAIAKALKPLAPPVTLSLRRAALESAGSLELTFFQNLHLEVEELRRHGVEKIHFVEMRESVAVMLGSDKWTRRAQALADDIVDFIRAHKSGGFGTTEILVDSVS